MYMEVVYVHYPIKTLCAALYMWLRQSHVESVCVTWSMYQVVLGREGGREGSECFNYVSETWPHMYIVYMYMEVVHVNYGSTLYTNIIYIET